MVTPFVGGPWQSKSAIKWDATEQMVVNHLEGRACSGALGPTGKTVWIFQTGLRKPVVTSELLARALPGIRSQYQADFLCGVSIGLLNEVRVDTEGRRRIRVTQAAAHRPHRHAFR